MLGLQHLWVREEQRMSSSWICAKYFTLSCMAPLSEMERDGFDGWMDKELTAVNSSVSKWRQVTFLRAIDII